MLSSTYIQDKEKQSRYRSMKSGDLLSNLPDELLANILSFMPTKDAIETGFLSSRWRNLWKFAQGFDIGFSKDLPREVAASNIRKLLSAIRSSKLFKLHVKGLSPSLCDADDLIGALVSFSLDHHVEDLKFVFNHEDEKSRANKSLSSVFGIKDLVRLQLHNSCEVTLPSSIRLPLLQTLVLDWVEISREAVEELICECPSLQSLYLNTSSVKDININHPKLRYLVILSSVLVGLRAPALKYLEMDKLCVTNDYKESEGLVFMDVPTLATCVFHSCGRSACFNFPLPTLWKVLLNDLHHVKTIHLDYRCIEGLSTTPVPTEQMLGCTSLFIKVSLKRNCSIDALAKILRVFSRIEKLTIVLEEYYCKRYGYSTTWKPLVQVLSEFQPLKEVEVHGFCIFSENTKNCPTAAWTLIKLLSGKLQNIEKLTFDVSKDSKKFWEIFDKCIHKNVRNLRRASTFASVEFPSYLYYETCLTMYTN